MKKPLLLLVYLFIFLIGCTKTNVNEVPAGTSKNYPSGSGTYTSPGGPFSFTKLEASPTTISIGTMSKIKATATGSNLTFTWSTPHGDIFGTGPEVYYSDSCIGTYNVTCKVSDGSNVAEITISITITN